MTSSPLISIIIPAYNVSEWLPRSVYSLLKQTLCDFELWLVDDGSTDSTGSVCDELASTDERIRVIHQTNHGAAAARNVALSYARGSYVYFMDGDDWCEFTMLHDLYTLAAENNLDLVITGFYIDTYYSETKYYREERTAPNAVYGSQRAFREAACSLFDGQLLYAPWNKLYKRSFLQEHSLEFPDTFWDDLPFNLSVIRDVERVGCIDGHYYHFLRAREESENTKYRADMYEKREEENEWMCDLYDYWESTTPGVKTPEVDEMLARRYVERLVGCVENLTAKSCTLSNKEKKQKIRHIISTPQAKRAFAIAQPNSLMMKIILSPMESGNATRTKLQSSFISWVKQNNTSLFARLKANR